MKISEPQLYKIYYTKKFNKYYPIENDCELILNRMHVYAMKNNECEKQVDFNVRIDKTGDKFIEPNVCFDEYDGFLLTCDRLVMARKMEVEPSDIINKIEHNDGGYSFVFNAD